MDGKDVKSPQMESLQGNGESGAVIQTPSKGVVQELTERCKPWELTLGQSGAPCGAPLSTAAQCLAVGKQMQVSR